MKRSMQKYFMPSGIYLVALYENSAAIPTLNEPNAVSALTYLQTFAFGHFGGEVGGAFSALLPRSGVISPLAPVSLNPARSRSPVRHQPLISSSSKVTRLPRPRAQCHSTPSFSLFSSFRCSAKWLTSADTRHGH